MIMRVKVGVMGSAATESTRLETGSKLVEKAEQLARVIASKDVLLFTGATTGIVYVVGKTAHDAGIFHGCGRADVVRFAGEQQGRVFLSCWGKRPRGQLRALRPEPVRGRAASPAVRCGRRGKST